MKRLTHLHGLLTMRPHHASPALLTLFAVAWTLEYLHVFVAPAASALRAAVEDDVVGRALCVEVLEDGPCSGEVVGCEGRGLFAKGVGGEEDVLARLLARDLMHGSRYSR